MNVKNRKLLTAVVTTTMLATTALTGFGATLKSAPAPTSNKDKVFSTLNTWPKPPLWSGNVYAANGIGDYATAMIYEGLFQYVRSTSVLVNKLAESYENRGNMTIIHLRKGVKWHDGQPFTSKDVWAYYILNNGVNLTHQIDRIETPDANTVVFVWPTTQVFNEMKMQIIAPDKQATIPYHIFKKYVDKADAALKLAKKATDISKNGPFGLDITPDVQKQLDANWADFQKYTTSTPIGTGPFKFSKVTDTQFEMVKNPNYWDVKDVNFDKVELYQVADVSSQIAMERSGKLLNYDGTPPKDILEELLSSNKDLVHYMMADPVSAGIMFNAKKGPLADLKFRQALVYALDRKKVREFANYYGTEYNKYSSLGIGAATLDQWVTKATQAKMTNYSTNLTKAAALLKEIGYTKGSDGIWVDKNGKKPNLTIGAAAGWAPTINYSQAVAEQLTAFGIPTQVKVQDGSIYWTNAPKGEYDMATDWIDNTWSWSDPQGYMNQWSVWVSKLEGLPRDSKDKVSLSLTGPTGKKINMGTWIDTYSRTMDLAKRKQMVNDVVYALNENAFGIGLYQSVTGVFINMKEMGGNLPMASEIEKYNRNMPLPTKKKDIEDIAKLNLGFGGNLQVTDGNYWPK